MTLIKTSAAILFAAAITATGALAGTGAEGVFTIHNDTETNVVSGFYTSEDDGETWSTNWLSIQVRPGESAEARFHANSGPCEQVLQVGWVGDDSGEVLDEPISIDICEASNVYLEDNDVSFD